MSLIARLSAILVAVAVASGVSTARGYTPDSPEVKSAIEKGLIYLQAHREDRRMGSKALVGLCFLKAGRPINDPVIQDAITECVKSAKAFQNETYSPALAFIFLCELQYEKPELKETAQQYLDLLLQRQQAGGAWGYLNVATGDTSQTQYGALAMWMAANHGYQVPKDTVERLCGWLVRTQTPTGTWAYQGNDPGAYQRIHQVREQRLSLHVGGAGSMYITADLLGMLQSKPAETENDRNLPPALRAVSKAAEVKRPTGKLGPLKLFDPLLARTAIADADRYFDANYTIAPREQVHYYLYGLERYQSFKELAAGRWEKEPKWYNDGCAHLMATQRTDGSWPESGESSIISTSFSVLFLSRSSRKSIAHIVPNLGDGVLLGGMGLPPNVADLVERDGKIVETPLAGSIDELLSLIEKPNAELDQLVDPRQPLTLDGDITKRAGQVARLRSLVSAGSYDARMVAVKTLGRTRELDNVPVLIYALSDPDLRIVLAADRALRFYSRKFSGVGLPDNPKAADIQAAAKAWKDWYKSVRPEAEFLD